jgi:hypothetical protein
MRRVPVKAILGTVAFGALLGGCATTVEMGPGYYHYNTGLARPSVSVAAPAVVYQEPAVVYREPTLVYREPAVVYREPTIVYRDSPVVGSAIVYREPTVVYRLARDSAPYKDHGQ